MDTVNNEHEPLSPLEEFTSVSSLDTNRASRGHRIPRNTETILVDDAARPSTQTAPKALSVSSDNALPRPESAHAQSESALLSTILQLESSNKQLKSQTEQLQNTIRDQTSTIDSLRKKLRVMVENNELKQRIIQEFEKRLSGQRLLAGDSKSLGNLRDYQALKLQELYNKSRKHLDVERKQNLILRKNLDEIQTAGLVESLTTDISALRSENKELKKENATLRSIQHHHERALKMLDESQRKSLLRDYSDEVAKLKGHISRLEEEQRLFSGSQAKLGLAQSTPSRSNITPLH
ncbi:uncharacterized protein BJ171DRAFT_492985 [Polychytrium aggregatum]|uniref:uncharacterized protein n=1 Tax=Polychytrium aggregatum TaxID=110093 RepID=UPI0022FEC45B|nr:uncharacterized protein BJ171DRAFT_492985 [Polychytrium aggregatum]KAI9207541.1 hypothetical protein BJ171DRAFT_492985 [Polychytrium aggregatum]